MLKIDGDLEFLKDDCFSSRNVNMAKIYERLLSENIPREETLDEKMDLHYICTAQRCWKHIFALKQTCSKRGKVHICYHIYTDVQIW